MENLTLMLDFEPIRVHNVHKRGKHFTAML